MKKGIDYIRLGLSHVFRALAVVGAVLIIGHSIVELAVVGGLAKMSAWCAPKAERARRAESMMNRFGKMYERMSDRAQRKYGVREIIHVVNDADAIVC